MPVVEKRQKGRFVEGPSSKDVDGLDVPLSGAQLIHAPVLVLNLNYVPLNICNVRRAVILVGKGKAELLENHRGQLRTVSSLVDVPSIIRLVYLVKKPFLPRKLSKKEVFLRDKFTCQYCGKKVPDLTLDHVVPRRQHGSHTWENVVAACNRCNLRKAGRTPRPGSGAAAGTSAWTDRTGLTRLVATPTLGHSHTGSTRFLSTGDRL